MLNALGIQLRRVGGYADRQQQIDDDAMASANPLGQTFPGFGQEHAAVGPRDRQALAFQTANRFDHGGVRHAQTAGDVGGARLPVLGHQIRDQFHIIFQQRPRLG